MKNSHFVALMIALVIVASISTTMQNGEMPPQQLSINERCARGELHCSFSGNGTTAMVSITTPFFEANGDSARIMVGWTRDFSQSKTDSGYQTKTTYFGPAMQLRWDIAQSLKDADLKVRHQE